MIFVRLVGKSFAAASLIADFWNNITWEYDAQKPREDKALI